jgi:hypothetical protein
VGRKAGGVKIMMAIFSVDDKRSTLAKLSQCDCNDCAPFAAEIAAQDCFNSTMESASEYKN